MGWLTGWNKRIKITLDSTKIGGILSNFPTPIKIKSSELDPTTVNIAHVRFTTSDGTTICNHTRVYHESDEMYYVVSLNLSNASNVECYMYWDNPSAVDTTTNAPFSAYYAAYSFGYTTNTSTIKNLASSGTSGQLVKVGTPVPTFVTDSVWGRMMNTVGIGDYSYSTSFFTSSNAIAPPFTVTALHSYRAVTTTTAGRIITYAETTAAGSVKFMLSDSQSIVTGKQIGRAHV